MQPLIVNVALTGMVPAKADTPHVPVTPEEIVADALACAARGASIVHVHARDGDGRPTHRADAYAPIVEGIRAAVPDLIVCVSCSGRDVADVDARAEVLSLDGDAKPDMASLTLGSLNFARQASTNSPDTIRALAKRMRDRDIAPEVEVFEPGMLAFASRLQHEGLLGERAYANVLLGNLGTAPPTPAMLSAFLSVMPGGWTWGIAGIGRHQLDATLLAVATAPAVRTGIEDNLWFDRERTTLATNERLVQRVADLAALADRPLATPSQTRTILGLP
jgi:3-keto-5-aminohexanoate cleavage enzyme